LRSPFFLSTKTHENPNNLTALENGNEVDEFSAVQRCLQKAHLSVIPDDGKAPLTTDHTRCAAYNRYLLEPIWTENDFRPNQFSTEPTIFEDFEKDLDTNWVIDYAPDSYNYELQFYTTRPENVRIENGHLKLIPLKETFQHRQYTSGKVTNTKAGYHIINYNL